MINEVLKIYEQWGYDRAVREVRDMCFDGSYLEGGVLFGSKQVARKFFQAYMVLFVELSQIIADLLMSWVKVEL